MFTNYCGICRNQWGNIVFTGKVLKLGDNINTDDIIAGQYLRTDDPSIWKTHIFETLDPQLSIVILQKKFIIAGKNFGCGSSREQAVVAIKSCGIVAIIAHSFGRIFYRNCINNGVLAITFSDLQEIDVNTEDVISLDPNGSFFYTSSNKKTPLVCPPPFAMQIYQAGGLIDYYQQHELKGFEQQ